MSSRSIGRRFENLVAALLGGKRISETGMPGPDIADAAGNPIEVKYGKQVPVTIYNYMDQMAREGASYTVLKRPRKPWLVVCYLDDWKASNYHKQKFPHI